MASRQALKRLTKEYKAISLSPPPFIIAKPNEVNILEWHYLITGPPGTPFENGQYHGILRFPSEYPFKPPAISVVTPSGRFACNTRLCLSMSDYHPDTWNPSWSVATILTGLLSFMTGDESTTGSINSSDNVKKRLARESKQWNLEHNRHFSANFPELIGSNKADIERMKQEDSQKSLPKKEQLFDRSKIDSLDPEDRARFLVENEEPQSSYSLHYFIVTSIIVVAVLAFFPKRFLDSSVYAS